MSGWQICAQSAKGANRAGIPDALAEKVSHFALCPQIVTQREVALR
jgi:hypothetical protein